MLYECIWLLDKCIEWIRVACTWGSKIPSKSHWCHGHVHVYNVYHTLEKLSTGGLHNNSFYLAFESNIITQDSSLFFFLLLSYSTSMCCTRDSKFCFDWFQIWIHEISDVCSVKLVGLASNKIWLSLHHYWYFFVPCVNIAMSSIQVEYRKGISVKWYTASCANSPFSECIEYLCIDTCIYGVVYNIHVKFIRLAVSVHGILYRNVIIYFGKRDLRFTWMLWISWSFYF